MVTARWRCVNKLGTANLVKQCYSAVLHSFMPKIMYLFKNIRLKLSLFYIQFNNFTFTIKVLTKMCAHSC